MLRHQRVLHLGGHLSFKVCLNMPIAHSLEPAVRILRVVAEGEAAAVVEQSLAINQNPSLNLRLQTAQQLALQASSIAPRRLQIGSA